MTRRRVASRGMLFAILLESVHGCSVRRTDEQCDFGDGPWLPASFWDECDAPPNVFVPANDDCGYYDCHEGHWGKGFPDQGCGSAFVPAGPEPVFCPPYCLADLDPDPMVFGTACTAYPDDDAGNELAPPPRCNLVAGQWQLPPGQASCYAVSTGVGENPEVASACIEQGLNASIVVVGDYLAAVPPGYGLTVVCSYETMPPASCPDPNFLRDPPADECVDE